MVSVITTTTTSKIREKIEFIYEQCTGKKMYRANETDRALVGHERVDGIPPPPILSVKVLAYMIRTAGFLFAVDM